MYNFNKDLLINHSLNKTCSSIYNSKYIKSNDTKLRDNNKNIFTNLIMNENKIINNNIRNEINLIHSNINNINYKIENITYKLDSLNYKFENLERKIEKCNLDMQKMENDLEQRLNNKINQKFYQLNIYSQSNYNEFISKYNILTSEIQRIDSDLAIINFKMTLDTELSQFKLNKKTVNKNEMRENVKKENVKRNIFNLI